MVSGSGIIIFYGHPTAGSKPADALHYRLPGKLNPLATIMVILLGNLIWGVPGMILFVPLFAILKVIFDEIPQLHPYGYILGKEEEAAA